MPQYQGVWTLEQQALAQSNQQWVTDPNFKNTTLLLQADGTGSGSQNQTFLDGSTNNFFITRNGNTTQGSFSPFSQAPGYWSNLFNDQAVSIASVTASGTGDFTYEAWVYPTAAFGSLDNLWDHRSGSGHTSGMYFAVNSTGNIIIYNVTPSTNSIQVNQWSHIAFVRSSGTLTYYINGVSGGSQSFTRNNTDTPFYIGNANDGPTGVAGFVGYISNMRYATSAVYTSNFTPATSPLGITSGGQVPPTGTNTKVLGCQFNRFSYTDSAGAVQSFTVNGTPSVQAFGPFAPALQWTPTVVGGSGYFDGSGDYLNLNGESAFAFGTGDFTIQMWAYSQAAGSGGSQPNLYDGRPAGTPSGSYPTIVIYTSNEIAYYVGSGVQISGGTMVLNTWNHIAVCRSGTSTKMYLNGVQTGSTWTDTTNYVIGTNRPTIGIDGNTVSGNYFTGYIAGLQVLKGTALYTGSTYTVPTLPPTAVTNTSFLLNSTNAGLYDGKMNTVWGMWKTSGGTPNNVQISTNPVKYGSGSFYFDGTTYQNLMPAQNYPQLTFGTGDFTIECWLYCIGKGATTVNGIIDYRPGVNGTYINWVLDFGGYGQGSTTAPKLVLYADSAVFIASNVFPLAQWNHIALCRANGITRMFINGVLASTPTADTKNYGSGGGAATYRPTIGCTDGGDSMYGYIDDFRISRFARYIANFTPPQQALPRQ